MQKPLALEIKLTFRGFKANWPSKDHFEAKVLIYLFIFKKI